MFRRSMDQPAYPPETVEGWYVLHQLFSVDRTALRAVDRSMLPQVKDHAARALCALREPAEGGWSAVVPLIGSLAEVMLVHFRPTLEQIESAQLAVARERLAEVLRPAYTFLSVTEAGLYHITAELAKEAVARGGEVGDAAYESALAERVKTELESTYMQRRLRPELPPGMPYVCFYPMSKKREAGQNWYTLTLDQRSRLMYSHGMVGRRYAKKIVQVVSGAIGLDEWEWGVTLFARDPLEFKKIVTEMRFDEATARYGEFGPFYVGKVADPAEWVGSL